MGQSYGCITGYGMLVNINSIIHKNQTIQEKIDHIIRKYGLVIFESSCNQYDDKWLFITLPNKYSKSNDIFCPIDMNAYQLEDADIEILTNAKVELIGNNVECKIQFGLFHYEE